MNGRANQQASTSDTSKTGDAAVDKMHISYLAIYKSVIILGLYIVIMEVVFFLASLILRIPLGFFITSLDTANTLYSFNTIVGIGFYLVRIVFIIVLVFQWTSDHYELSPGRLIHKSGFFFRQEKEFNFSISSNRMSNITLTQGFLGRLFNFGTISIYAPISKEWFYLNNIPDPHQVLILLRKTLAGKSVEVLIAGE